LTNTVLGLDSRRSLPRFRRDTFWRWWQQQSVTTQAHSAKTVVLLADTFTNYYEPAVAIDAVRVLEAAGYTVVVPKPTCCGRPQISKGLHAPAIDAARATVTQLLPYLDRGVPILGLEPSCLLTFRDEYPSLLQSEESKTLAAGSWLVEEFLANEAAAGQLTLNLHSRDSEVLLHGHCHQKAIATTRATRAALDLIPGLTVSEIDSGCCGMAGSFGYEAGHYDLSAAMAERVLAPRIRAASQDTTIVANGTSCRHQIADLTGRTALHVVQVLARALNTSG
jgi:Fe-S oxidoreductase